MSNPDNGAGCVQKQSSISIRTVLAALGLCTLIATPLTLTNRWLRSKGALDLLRSHAIPTDNVASNISDFAEASNQGTRRDISAEALRVHILQGPVLQKLDSYQELTHFDQHSHCQTAAVRAKTKRVVNSDGAVAPTPR
jgi:hypothetical protein